MAQILQHYLKMNLIQYEERMGMVFQYSALFDSMSVGENVAFGLRQHTDLGDDEIQTHCSRETRLGRFERV